MSFTNGFDDHGGVNVDPTTSLIAEFNSLALQNKWKKTSSKYNKQRGNFVRHKFEVHFGSNISGLGGWQALCEAVGIADIPSSITQCKKVRTPHPPKRGLFSRFSNPDLMSLFFQLLKKVDVNIYDLVDAARTGTVARTFTDTRQLEKYTKENGKVFPKAYAKQNKLLKFMLRHIIN
jgi:hypothetical protein